MTAPWRQESPHLIQEAMTLKWFINGKILRKKSMLENFRAELRLIRPRRMMGQFIGTEVSKTNEGRK